MPYSHIHTHAVTASEISLKIINLDYEHIVRRPFFRSSLRNHRRSWMYSLFSFHPERQRCLVYCLLIELSTARISRFNLFPPQPSPEQLVTPIQFVRGAFYLSRGRATLPRTRGGSASRSISHLKKKRRRREKEERGRKKGDTTRRW